MGTSDEANTTDTLGRSVPPRRYRAVEEKRQIVEETLVPGASVATIARRHEVNANLVFGWRKLYHKGLLGAGSTIPATPLLPVRIKEHSPVRRPGVRRGRLQADEGRSAARERAVSRSSWPAADVSVYTERPLRRFSSG